MGLGSKFQMLKCTRPKGFLQYLNGGFSLLDTFVGRAIFFVFSYMYVLLSLLFFGNTHNLFFFLLPIVFTLVLPTWFLF